MSEKTISQQAAGWIEQHNGSMRDALIAAIRTINLLKQESSVLRRDWDTPEENAAWSDL